MADEQKNQEPPAETANAAAMQALHDAGYHESGVVPPQSLEAEQSVLGALMLSEGAAFEDLPPALRSDDFYRAPHQVIFRAFGRMFAARQSIDSLTLVEHLRETDELDRAGGPSYIAGLPDVVPSTAHLEHYARIVMGKARLRRLMRIGANLAAAATSGAEASEVEAALSGWLRGLEVGTDAESVSAKQTSQEVFAQIERALETGEEPGVPTGIAALDERLKIMPTDFVVIAGRPGSGKSFLALQIARAITGQKKRVLFAGLEMHRHELLRRMMRAEGELRRPDTMLPRTPEAQSKVVKALDVLSQLEIRFMRDTDLDVILREAGRLQRNGGLGMVVVDYFQKLRTSGPNRDQALTELAQRMKNHAMSHEVPVLAMAALSRESEKRDDPRPRMSDLRECGGLEYEANAILFVHVPGRTKNGAAEDDHERTELLIAKQRDSEDQQVIAARRDFDFARFTFGEVAPASQQSLWEKHKQRTGGGSA